ncbi:MAG: hypothetical protein ICCCNLDF_02809 [Planctomycetes bacterium]|nr:hypothetical protein [Planctomycetota bacterium]
MTLTALTHVKHTTGAPAANTVHGWLEAVYDTLNGAMTHWTVTRYQNGGATECLYFTPKAGQALTKNVRIMIAGADSGTLTPTMGTNSSFANSTLFMAMVIGAGAFDAWDAASPFTSHDYYTGFCHAGLLSSIAAEKFEIFETAETLWVIPVVTGAGVSYRGGGCAGALIDPESSVSTNVSATADSRVWAISTFGSTTFEQGWWIGATSAYLFYHSSTSNAPKCLFLHPDGTWDTLRCVGPYMESGGSPRWTQADGSPWLLPCYGAEQAGGSKVLGRLREVYMGPYMLYGVDIYNSADERTAYGLGSNRATPYGALCLKAA